MIGYSTKIKHKDNPKIARKVLSAKIFPTCFLARNIKGMFKTKIISEIERGVKCDIRSEIPVIPPSINPFGIKNPLSPKPAVKMPSTIKKDSFDNAANSLNTLFMIISRNLIL